MIRPLAAMLLIFVQSGCVTTPRPEPALEMAITVDDMPVHGALPARASHRSLVQAIIAALQAERIDTATGFLNGVWTERDPATEIVFTQWRAAGLPLANHGWSHRHLNEMSPAEFETEVARNEPLLRRLSAGEEWRWFRYPFLDEGETEEKRAAGRAILARRGYRVAAVTMDFSDWAWTDPYARCTAKGDTVAIKWLEASYMQAARETVAFNRTLSRKLYGRDIPYVLLLHIGGMTARMMPKLLDLYRTEGFGFVGLGQAQRDSYYRADNDPSLPAEPHTMEGRALAKGIDLPARTDFQPRLAKVCL